MSEAKPGVYVLASLSKHANTVTALAIINGVAIVVLVLVTGYYAWQTREMAREMRAARLLSLLPKLVLDMKMIGPTYASIVVANVGVGPAIQADLEILFEAGEKGGAERRPWRAHVIAPGERHEFLPPQDIGDLNSLAARHPSISLHGQISDAFGERREVDERIDIAEWAARLGKAVHRWQEEPADRLIRELEKGRRELEQSRRELSGLGRQLSVLATLADRWRRGDTSAEDR